CHTVTIAATGPATGSHAAHNTTDCSKCHANSSNNTTIPTANHANGFINVTSGYPSTTKHAVGTYAANAKCSTASCHADVYGPGTVLTPKWGTTGNGCSACHIAYPIGVNGPATGSHTAHAGKVCTSCHAAGTTATTVPSTGHADGDIDVANVSYLPNVTKHTAGSGYSSCSNVSCHSSGGLFTAGTLTWGAQATCDSCHPESGLSGAHQVHMGSLDLTSGSIYYNMTANRSQPITDSDTTYRPQGRTHGFGCANCHPMNVANHLNGSVDVDLNRVNVAGVSKLRFLNHSTASYTMATTKKCSNMYCHSNASKIEAESNVKSNTSLAWTDKFENYPATDRCGYCHGNQPTTGAHVAHAISNHSDNIYNGKNGKVGFGGTGNSAHGNPNTTTTITCYICHTDTINANAHGNDKNSRCRSCHDGTPISKGIAAINNLASHVNGKPDIKFAAIKVRSKAQIRPESFKFYSGVWKRTYYKNMTTLAFDESKVALDTATMWHPNAVPTENKCSNLACHNGYEAKWNMANWNDPNKCMDCHFKL
ncbi:MAG: CxxxxCH/CxxCH domain-containing protein, partial [Dehalococcoidia bacterium]